MHRLSSSTQPGGSATHERAIAILAHQSHVPLDHVTRLYERELTVLTVRARITGFLTIVTTRKVREILRQRRHPGRDAEALLFRQLISLGRHRPLHPTGPYFPRSGDRLNTDPRRRLYEHFCR